MAIYDESKRTKRAFDLIVEHENEHNGGASTAFFVGVGLLALYGAVGIIQDEPSLTPEEKKPLVQAIQSVVAHMLKAAPESLLAAVKHARAAQQ